LDNIIQTYIKRFAFQKQFFHEFKPAYINIVIPSYCEEGLIQTLQSLDSCVECIEKPNVLIVLNHPENEQEAERYHLQQMEILKTFSFEKFNLYALTAALPVKDAGVGLARKIGMDEVVRHCGIKDLDAWLICLDADCMVSKNYLRELYRLKDNPSVENVTLYFEHPYEKEDDEILKTGIIFYELFLRYYKNALEYIQYPYAHYTVGSCMGTRIKNYIKSGGMNKRKAGEDFYFLGKLFIYGQTMELNMLTVYPSCRISQRVPFGTGKAQWKFKLNPDLQYPSYHYGIFEILKDFFCHVQPGKPFDAYKVHPLLGQFLKNIQFEKLLKEVHDHSSSDRTFLKRFFQKADIFFVLKAVHFLRNNGLSDLPVMQSMENFFGLKGKSPVDVLDLLRKKEKSGTGNDDFLPHFQ
jgi:hypothetical protein